MSKNVKEIHRLLNNIVIPYKQLVEYIEYMSGNNGYLIIPEMQPLIDYVKNRPLRKLFRFRSYNENAINALENDELYLSRADKFNDPYDCLLCFDERKLRNRIAHHISKDNLKLFVEQNKSILLRESEFSNTDEFIDSCMSKRDAFLDYVQQNFQKVSSSLQKSTYIACMSESVCSPIMWAHYADNQQGFAIEYQFPYRFLYPNIYFDLDIDSNSNRYGWRSLLPVLYSRIRTDGTVLADWYCLCEMAEKIGVDLKYDYSAYIPDTLLKTKLCIQKALEWSYEREWRLIITVEWPPKPGDSSASIKKSATAIYLGSNIADDHKNKLIEIALKKCIHVYEMYVDYTFKPHELKYRCLI